MNIGKAHDWGMGSMLFMELVVRIGWHIIVVFEGVYMYIECKPIKVCLVHVFLNF
jgi:hypothetical protein